MTTEKNNQTQSSSNPYELWQTYFEQQQTVVLNYWTQVLNSMWGIK